MSSFFLAPSLVALREEVNDRFPNRDKTSDGWIGDTSHKARKSDHNPDWEEDGIVRAVDIDIDDGAPQDDLTQAVLKATIGDSRVYYVIYNRRIYTSTFGFRARVYTGSNPHDKHIHVSIRDDDRAERDTSPWLGEKVRFKPLPIDLGVLRSQMIQARDGEPVEFSYAVRRLQRALNHKYGSGLDADGYAGPATLNAYGHHERQIGVVGAPRIPDEKTLIPLIRGRYFIKEEK